MKVLLSIPTLWIHPAFWSQDMTMNNQYKKYMEPHNNTEL